jgi:hypothetical protein
MRRRTRPEIGLVMLTVAPFRFSVWHSYEYLLTASLINTVQYLVD